MAQSTKKQSCSDFIVLEITKRNQQVKDVTYCNYVLSMYKSSLNTKPVFVFNLDAIL